MGEVQARPKKTTATYSLDETNVKWVRDQAVEFGKGVSDVVNEILRDYGPLYAADMQAHRERVLERQAAV